MTSEQQGYTDNAKPLVSETIRHELTEAGKRFWACDNISEFITPERKTALIGELTHKFNGVLDSLLIDRRTDPNSMDTGRRLAKMYVNELLAGRFEERPPVTAFPNTDPEQRYTGILNVRAEIKSMCSHHHQPVRGVAYIGLLPSTQVIGLSKYIRIAQWCARRGTLQEELARQIAKEIMASTQTEDVGVYIQARHGCCENRGIEAYSSLTQTTIVHGQFFNPSVKNEWMDQIKMQTAVASSGSVGG